MKKLFHFAMAIIFAMHLSAQTTVIVGDTNTTITSTYVPMYCYYYNSYSQSIYPASSLQPGQITSISYYHTASTYNNGIVKIYMKEVTDATLTNYLPGTDFVQVYEGPISLVNGWVTYNLAVPFEYTGEGNLLVGVIRDGAGYEDNHNFKMAEIGSSVYQRADNVHYDVNNPPSPYGSAISQVPVTKFDMIPIGAEFCYPPVNISVSDQTTDGATISWEVADESSTTFGIAYKSVTDEEWTTVAENIIYLTYTLTGLESSEEYDVKVYTVCSESNSNEISAVFTTLPSEDDFITLPFEESFDDLENLDYWTLTNPSANKWYIGALGHNSTSEDAEAEGNGLYISNDEGVSNAYTINSNGVAHASVFLNIEENTFYGISFDYKSVGEGTCCDYVGVRLVPFGQDLGTSITLSHMIDRSPYGTNNEWQRVNIEVPTSTTPGAYNLVFSWRNDSAYGENPPAAIDNVYVYTTSCTSSSLIPSVEVANTEDGTLELVVYLEDEVNVDATYVLQYRDSYQEEWTEVSVESFPYHITEGIEGLTNYEIKVGVLCSDAEEVIYIDPITITTPCQALQTPWTENFDVNPYNSTSCWERYSGLLPASGTIQTSQLTTTSSSNCWGWASNFACGETTSNMIRSELYSTSGYIYWAITPSINLADDGVAKQIAFDLGLRKWGSNTAPDAASDDRVMVLVSLDNGLTWNIANGLVFADGDEDPEHNYSDLTTKMTRYVYKLVDENEEPIVGAVRFAFYSESTVSNADNYACIDNIAVEDYVSCPAPYNIAVSNATITSTSAIATFGYYGPATTLEYVVVEGADADPNTATAEEITSTDPIELTDLNPATTYTFAVRAICEDGESDWTSITFTTLAAPEEIPYETSFDVGMWSVDNGSNTPNAWVVGEATGNEAPAAYISNDGTAYTATQTSSPTISHLWKDFDFGQTEEDFELSFDWKVTGHQEGTSVSGGVALYLVDPTPLPTTGMLNEDNRIAIVTGSDQWQTERIFLGNITGEKRLVFTAFGYTRTEELVVPAAIDNVSLVVSPCSQVQDVVLSNSTTTTIDVAWTLTESDSYTISYRAAGSEEMLTATATESPFTITGLTSGTQYYVSVTAVCGSNEAIPSSTVVSYTLQEPTDLPYTCNFDEEGDNGWLLKNGSCINKWYIGTPADLTNGKLYISDSNGTSASYSTNSVSVVVAEKLFQLGATDSIRISFDLTIRGESVFDYLKVYWVPADTVYEASDNEDVYYGKSTYANGVIMNNCSDPYYTFVNLVTGTQNMSVTLLNNPNELRKLVFVWKNDGGVGSQPPAIIDNIMIEEVGEEITCFKPIDNSLTATNLTSTSATISWQISDESQSAWNVYYKAESDEEYSVIAASETSLELSNLMPNTQYTVYVKTDCGGEESSASTTLTFRTECIALTAPLIEDFASDITVNPCWQKAEGLLSNNISLDYSSSDWIATSAEVDGNSTGKARINIYGDDKRDWLITPVIDLGEEGILYELSLKVALTYYYDATAAPESAPDDKFAIVVSTDGGNTWSSENALIFADGDADATHNFSDLTTSFAIVTYPLQDAEGNPLTGLIKVGFYGESTQDNGDNNLFIDDLIISEVEGEEPQPCDAPTALAASNITETSADITWNGTALTYEFKLNSGAAETLTTTSKALTGLTANTAYTVEVRAICEDQQSAWVTTTFTTLAEQGGEEPDPEIVAPVVVTSAATGVDHQSAILNGTITAGSETITAQGFQYKAQSATTWSEVSATGTTISAVVNGLTEQTTYIFKAFATTASGTVEGNEMTFTTIAAPIVVVLGEVTTSPATNVGNTSATLNGALVSAGESENFTVGFALATVADFTLETEEVQNITSTLSESAFTATVNDLAEGQTYFYRAYITNEAGTAYGAVETFTLLSLAEEIAGALQVSLYPNPAQENATMEIVGLDQDAKIVISDLQGRILSQEAISAGETHYTINVSNMASGVYYIRIVTDKAVSTQKLIVE